MFYVQPKVMFNEQFITQILKPKCSVYVNDIRMNEPNLEDLIPMYKDFANWMLDQCAIEQNYVDLNYVQL